MKRKLLTQEEVDALPEGTTVFVKWSGGNGPWEYEISKNPHLPTQSCVNNVYRDILNCVGSETGHTKVWIKDALQSKDE